MSKMPDYNAIIIFGVKNSEKLLELYVNYTGQPAVKENVTKTRKKGKRK